MDHLRRVGSEHAVAQKIEHSTGRPSEAVRWWLFIHGKGPSGDRLAAIGFTALHVTVALKMVDAAGVHDGGRSLIAVVVAVGSAFTLRLPTA